MVQSRIKAHNSNRRASLFFKKAFLDFRQIHNCEIERANSKFGYWRYLDTRRYNKKAMFVRGKKSCVAISFVHKGNVDIILLMLDKNHLCYINGLCTQSYKINELRRDSRTCNITFCNTVLNSKQYVTFNCILTQVIHNHNFLCRKISKESLIRLVSYCVGS